MATYLKIENPGICPVEGFILLGATSKRLADNDSPYCIGQFGSGQQARRQCPVACQAVPRRLLRQSSAGVRDQAGQDEGPGRRAGYNRVVVKHGGTDEDGTSVTYTEELSQTDEYGVLDWNCLGMAFREFVSNAIDAAIAVNRQAETATGGGRGTG